MTEFAKDQGEFVFYCLQANPALLPVYRIAFFDGPFKKPSNQFFMTEDTMDPEVDSNEPFRGVILNGFPHFNFQRTVQNVHGKPRTYEEAREQLMQEAIKFVVREKVRQHSYYGKIYGVRNQTGLDLSQKALGILETLAQETRSAVTGPNSTGEVRVYAQEAINHALQVFSKFC